MLWQELITRALSAMLVVTAALYTYTWALLQIGQRLDGVMKTVLSVAAYLVMAGILGAALIFVLTTAGSSPVSQSWSYVLGVFLGWIVVVLPGFLHLRSRLKALQRHGFFVSAWSSMDR